MTKIFKLISLLYLIINCMSIVIADENFFNKGLKLFKDKKYEDARFMFERGIVFNPKDSNSYLYLAKIYNIQEDLDKEEKNLDELINLIKENLKNKFISSEEIFITRQRHRMNLEECVVCLKNFEEKNTKEDFDKAAEDLRLATRYLGMIVGKVDVEEILGSIFSDFCIGK